MSRLQVDQLSVSLGGRAIVQEISFALEAGEVLALVGASGAGKTTVFRAVAGEIPYRGRVLLDDRCLDGLPLWRRARRGLGYVPQTPSVLFDLSVEANIRSYAQLIGRGRVAPEDWAARFGLAERLGTKARSLSGGERRSLELLRAALAAPKVLICDEPFAGVDPVRASGLSRNLTHLCEQGAAVLLADHRVSELATVCDKAIVMRYGRAAVRCSGSELVGAQRPTGAINMDVFGSTSRT